MCYGLEHVERDALWVRRGDGWLQVGLPACRDTLHWDGDRVVLDYGGEIARSRDVLAAWECVWAHGADGPPASDRLRERVVAAMLAALPDGLLARPENARETIRRIGLWLRQGRRRDALYALDELGWHVGAVGSEGDEAGRRVVDFWTRAVRLVCSWIVAGCRS